MSVDAPPPAERPPRVARGRALASGAAALLVAAVVLGLLLAGGDDGSPDDRRAALRATAALDARVAERPAASAAQLCAAAGSRTRAGLARLAAYLPEPGSTCDALPPRLVRAVLAPPPAMRPGPLRARVTGATAVVSRPGGAEVSRATRDGEDWRADPGAGGLGAWRLETARRCSAALTSSRLAPLSGAPASYRTAVAVRLRGVTSVLSMLAPQRVPSAIDGLVGEARGGLTQLRDGLQRALQATDGGDLAKRAPDSAELPSVLQLLEAFAGLRDLGAPCLGGPASATAVRAGDAVCRAARLPVDTGFKDVGRSASEGGVAEGFRTLARAWRTLAAGTGAVDLRAAPRLLPVRDAAVRSARAAEVHAERLAVLAASGRTSTRDAADLDLAQQSAVDALMALGFRECGAIS